MLQLTKFDELWNAYCSANREHQMHLEALLTFLPQFIKQLVKQLGWSSSLVEIGASEEEFLSYEKAILCPEACLVPVPRSYCGHWEFWMKFGLANQGLSFFFSPPKPVSLLVRFNIFQIDGYFRIKVSTATEEFNIENVKSEEFSMLVDFVVKKMRRKIEGRLMWELEVNKKLNQIVI